MFRQEFKKVAGNRFVLSNLPAVSLILFTVFTLNINRGWLFTIAAYLVSTSLPSIHITRVLKRTLGMEGDELLVINFIIGNGLLNLVYVYLNTVLPVVSRFTLMATLILVSLVSGLLTYFRSGRDELNSNSSLFSQYFGVLLAASPGVYRIWRSLPNDYWRGDDPWGLAVVAKGIFENGFSPAEAFEFYKGYFPLFTSGFYYHVAGIMTVTGASVETLVRYGGIVIAGTLTALSYIIVKRVTSKAGGLVAAFFLFLNPFMVVRFSSPLREYYGYVVLITMIYLNIIREKESGGLNPVFILTQAGLFSVAVVNHSLTPILILGVLALDSVNSIIKKKFIQIYETVAYFILALLMAGPYYPFLYQPILDFFGIGVTTMVALGIIGLASLAGILYVIKDRIREESFTISRPVRLVFLVLLATIFTVNVFYPPKLGSSYTFGYMSIYHYSRTFALISVIGFFSLALFNTPLQVYALGIEVSLFAGLSYAGIGVPLDRLELYGMWVMCYASAQLIGTLLQQFRFEPFTFDKRPTVKDIKEYIWSNRHTTLLLLLIITPYLSEVTHVRQAPYTYNSADVKATREFAETVQPSDLAVPHIRHVHMMYYADIPHESQINLDDPWSWKHRFYASDTVYNMSDFVQESFPDKERVHFYTMNDEYRAEVPGSLSMEILEDYGYEVVRGETRSYTFNIPFTLDSLPIENVRFVGNNGHNVLDSSIAETSNILHDSSGYRMYYSTTDSMVGYTTSSDGVEWNDKGLILDELEDPFIVRQGNYRMYAIDAEGSLVSLDSSDGTEWSNQRTIVEAETGYGFWELDSPVVWVNGSEWNMIYTLTQVNSTIISTGLIHRTSSDGVTWLDGAEFKPILVDKLDQHQEYEKLLLTDVFEFERGLMFLGRFKAKKLYGSMEWKTGSLWFDQGVKERNACLRSFTYTDHPEESRNVQSIQYTTGPSGEKMYYYTLDSVHLGYVDDDIGLDKELVVEP